MLDFEPESIGLERKLDLLIQTGLLLAREVDLEPILQTVIRVGLELLGAQFGAFFSLVECENQGCVLYALNSEKELTRSPLSYTPGLLAGPAVERVGDLTQINISEADWEFFRSASGAHPPQSYLAVAVVDAAGCRLGRLIYTQTQTHAFSLESQKLVEAIAAQAATAIQNVLLRRQNQQHLVELQLTQRRLEDAVRPLGVLAAIVESSDDAIISKDLNGTILTWNASASRILGYSEPEIIGQSILKLIPDELQGEEQTILDKIRSGQRIDHYETIRVTKTGERLNVSLSISPIRDSLGRVVGASKILRDVTERKRMEASLLEAEKIAATGRMAATIAHEINNPLEAVVNLLYLARSSGSLEQSNDYISAAEAEVGRVSHIARQTLGFYRDNASATSTPISDLAADALRIYTPRCHALGIGVDANLCSRRSIVVRSGEILQVLSNLIANAIQAMGEGDRLTVSVEDTQEPAGVVINVTDTGTGIAQEQLPHIFEAFFTTRGSIGTGIGLFIANQIITAHGGSIRADTSAKPTNHGTTMSVFLPLVTSYTSQVH